MAQTTYALQTNLTSFFKRIQPKEETARFRENHIETSHTHSDDLVPIDMQERQKETAVGLTDRPNLPQSSSCYSRSHVRSSGFTSKPSVSEPTSYQEYGKYNFRKGDYDYLNYAPIYQNKSQENQPPAIQSAASQRARKNVQMLGVLSASKRLCLLSNVIKNEDDKTNLEVNMNSSFIFDDEQPVRRFKKMALPSGIDLGQHEIDVLDEILMDLPKLKTNNPITKQVVQESSKMQKDLHLSPTPPICIYRQTPSILSLKLENTEFVDKFREEEKVISKSESSQLFSDYPSQIADECLNQNNSFDINALSDWDDDSTRIESKKRTWHRCKVSNVKSRGDDLVVTACDFQDLSIPLTIKLSGSWTCTDVRKGDIVNVVPNNVEGPSHTFSLSDKDENEIKIPSLFILHPDQLISSTSIAGSITCLRRSILQQFWPSGDALEDVSERTLSSGGFGGPQVMLIGSIVHDTFQRVVQTNISTLSPSDALFASLFKPSILLNLYALKIPTDTFCEQLNTFLPMIMKWKRRYLSKPGKSVRSALLEVIDIEENIWCQKLGLKGKIDLTVKCWSVDQNQDSPKSVIIPLELKTGRPSYSPEHIGQVLLYILMLRDRHEERLSKTEERIGDFGWLAYLRETIGRADMTPEYIQISANNLRGLMQARNELTVALDRLTDLVDLDPTSPFWIPTLPVPVDREHICSRCSHLAICGLFRLADQPNKNVVQILQDAKNAHLTERDVRYLHHWSHLQLMEFAASEQLETTVSRIVAGSNANLDKEENNFGSYTDLKVYSTLKTNDNEYHITLRRFDSGPIPVQGSVVDDFLIISSNDGRHICLCLGTVISFVGNCDSHISRSLERRSSICTPFSITLKTDRQLPDWISLYRLDRFISNKSVYINLSNLTELMTNSPLCARLRRLLIDYETPRFLGTISKTVIVQIRKFLKPLNACQRTAVLSVLMSKDYTLIEGFPGSGKTETLACLIHCLASLKKTVLVISNTHSAVDNVLLRLIKSPDIKIVRLGTMERIHKDLREHNLEQSLARQSDRLPNVASSSITPVISQIIDEIEQKLTNADVVGCSALAAGGGSTQRHAALSRHRFDVVIVDEATQLLLPTVIGGLFCLKSIEGQFVLVGDPKQLPPLVKSAAARKYGFGESLFSLLRSVTLGNLGTNVTTEDADTMSHSGGGCHVQLRLQYRMNKRILHLVNRLFYDGQMKCASQAVAEATLPYDSQCLVRTLGPNASEWLTKTISPNLQDALVFLDTKDISKCFELENRPPKSNMEEVDIVAHIVPFFIRCGVEPNDIGIVTPYRDQVRALKQALRSLHGELEVNTVDQYQGRDKVIIIVSFVSCLNSSTALKTTFKSSCTSILNDWPRLTVALTRAKHKLVLIGCSCNQNQVSDTNKPNLSTEPLSKLLFALLQESVVMDLPQDWKTNLVLP